MLPPLKVIKAGLRRTTEALAEELASAHPGNAAPIWSPLEWQLASAVAVAHGICALLLRSSTWQQPDWQGFLSRQREHIEHRHQRIESTLKCIDERAQAIGLPVVALKGSALHAAGLYAPGDRPMADIDLLVRESDADAASHILLGLGYVESFAQWKHRVFKPRCEQQPITRLGEHHDTPINIELHTRIQERLPVSTVDITGHIYPRAPRPGLNDYPSNGALMAHLLLHAAGNMCGRSLRLMHMNDISLLATRLTAADWAVVWSMQDGYPWWALPPLQIVARYYRNAVPAPLLKRLQRSCPLLLRTVSRHQTLTSVSCSELWLHAFGGLEWSRSLKEVQQYLLNRIRPTREASKERTDMMRTQLWLQGQQWVTASHHRRVLAWLSKPVPRMDTLYVVRAAIEQFANT